jgi:hypothetical protein
MARLSLLLVSREVNATIAVASRCTGRGTLCQPNIIQNRDSKG